MRIMTVGRRSFVTSFRLAGVPGTVAETPEEALAEIRSLSSDPDVGLVLVGDDVASPIEDEITRLRTEGDTLVFALPASGATRADVDYRAMLKKILGM
ncbi:MAG: ATPase [Thaumarchaeota archaeon S13]|nr:MAG: ATPase [Thaumarchaeota archaeon S14]RNJ74143.1 MAG: ATPase [Thaumarchaeota archaeon S13]